MPEEVNTGSERFNITLREIFNRSINEAAGARPIGPAPAAGNIFLEGFVGSMLGVFCAQGHRNQPTNLGIAGEVAVDPGQYILAFWIANIEVEYPALLKPAVRNFAGAIQAN